MDRLEALDIELFRVINLKMVNPVCDLLMPFVSGNAFFVPTLVVAAVLLVWKDRLRGLVFVLLMALIIPFGASCICNTLKKAVRRPRPFLVLPDVHRPGLKAPAPVASASLAHEDK